ncbi:hypothetical protein FRACA_680003 [Frankia canadensis]|uniref:LD-carboxypeptidase C-terminal domain-containing protein n=1 Tax=Frankia canadensis TaxID=1836972 RepID=A0A2I2L0A4_9ACTN|nr:hypothetical protein FRACA_680003 [Frankia canadensis]SOU58619.1 hypothetical protein FRACA_680003 [Frankia canadensis]
MAGSDYPVLAHIEGGHTDPLPTFPIGVSTTVTGTDLIFEQRAMPV